MKKQWIRLLSLILCLSMVLSTGAVAYATEAEGNEVKEISGGG